MQSLDELACAARSAAAELEDPRAGQIEKLGDNVDIGRNAVGVGIVDAQDSRGDSRP